MFVYVHVYVHVCVSVCVNVCVRMYVFVCVFVRLCVLINYAGSAIAKIAGETPLTDSGKRV